MRKTRKESFRYITKILALLLAITMVWATIVGAMAVTVDDYDKFILKQGESIEASFILIDASSSGSISTTSPFITLSGKKSLAYSELEEFEDVLVVNYEVNVGEHIEVGRYVEKISISEGEEFFVTIDVQRDIFVDISRVDVIGHTKINPALVIFVVTVLLIAILSVILNKQLRERRSD